MLSSLSVTVVSPGTLSTFSTVEELPAGFSGVAELSAGLSAVVFPAGDLAAELSTFSEAHAERDRHANRATARKSGFFTVSFPPLFLSQWYLPLGVGRSRPP